MTAPPVAPTDRSTPRISLSYLGSIVRLTLKSPAV